MGALIYALINTNGGESNQDKFTNGQMLIVTIYLSVLFSIPRGTRPQGSGLGSQVRGLYFKNRLDHYLSPIIYFLILFVFIRIRDSFIKKSSK
jgi:hypothetical protein